MFPDWNSYGMFTDALNNSKNKDPPMDWKTNQRNTFYNHILYYGLCIHKQNKISNETSEKSTWQEFSVIEERNWGRDQKIKKIFPHGIGMKREMLTNGI